MSCCYVFSLICVLIELFLPRIWRTDPKATPRARFCFRHMQNAMKNLASAPGLSKAEAQRSFQQQRWGKLLPKVSPFFPHGSVFTVPSPRKLWLHLALPFLKYAIHHPLQGVLFTKRAFFFVFPGRKAFLDLMNRDKAFGAEHLNAAEPAHALGANREGMCFLRWHNYNQVTNLWLVPSNRVSLSGWGGWGSCNGWGQMRTSEDYYIVSKTLQAMHCMVLWQVSAGWAPFRSSGCFLRLHVKKQRLWNSHHFYLIGAVCYFMYLNYSKLKVRLGFITACHSNKSIFK